MAGHCIRHHELLASDLILWEPMHCRAQQGRPRQGYLSITRYMEGVIWRRSGLVLT